MIMKKGHLFTFIFLLFFAKNTFAQIGINATNTAPASSAMLDVSSTSKGLLIPRMTSAQRTGIPSPAIGLTVYDTDTQGFWFHNGATWQNLLTVASNSPWLVSGNNIYNSNSGTVSVGTSTPAPTAKFHVHTTGTDGSIVFTNATTTTANLRGVRLRLSLNDFYITNQETTGKMYFNTGSNTRMIITEAGNIGIGSHIPSFGLDVRRPDGSLFSTQMGDGALNTVRILKNILPTEPNTTNSALSVEAGVGIYGIEAKSENSPAIKTLSISGVGVFGQSTNFYGIYGQSTNSIGVYGGSQNNTGVFATSSFGTSLLVRKFDTQTGPTAIIENLSSINTSALLELKQASPSSALLINTSSTTGIELLNSTLKVSGTNKMAFQVASAGANPIVIPNTGFANSATDIIILTRVGVSVNVTTSVYVKYVGSNWNIYTENGSVVPAGELFNVLVFKQ